MHAKVTVCDDTVFVGSFNLSRSGEKNAENVLEIEDAAIADRLAAFVDEVRARYPAVTSAASGPGRRRARCRSLKPRAGRRVVARLADQREPDRHDLLRQAEQLVEDPLLVGMADERAREPFVDRGQQHEHHQRTGIDEPVRAPARSPRPRRSRPACRPRCSGRGRATRSPRSRCSTGASAMKLRPPRE